SPNGAWLAVNASGIILCDLAAKKWIDVSGPDYTDCQSFTPDGKWLAVTTDRDVRVIDTAAGKERCRIAVPKVRPQFAALSPDGATLAVMPTQWIHGTDLAVRLLSVPSGEEIKGLKGPSASAHWVGFSPDGKTILTGGWHGIREWDPVAREPGPASPRPAPGPRA